MAVWMIIHECLHQVEVLQVASITLHQRANRCVNRCVPATRVTAHVDLVFSIFALCEQVIFAMFTIVRLSYGGVVKEWTWHAGQTKIGLVCIVGTAEFCV